MAGRGVEAVNVVMDHVKALRGMPGTIAGKRKSHKDPFEKSEPIPEIEPSFVCVVCLTDIPCGQAGCAGTWIDAVGSNLLPTAHLDSDDDVAWRSALSDAYSIPMDEI